MSDQAPDVSIVIPARNEALRLPASLREIRRVFPRENWEFLVIVEPGTDDTVSRARQVVEGDPRFEIVENSVARGKGFAVKTGMLRARGRMVFFMDADLSVPLDRVPAFLGALDGHDVLIGSRRHPQSVIPVRQPWMRETSGRIFNLVLRLVGLTRITDTQCGFKAFRQPAAREIFSRIEQDGFGFDVEAVILAELLGFRLLELLVEWRDAKGSKVRFTDGVRALIEAVLAARRIRGKYSPHAQSRSQH